MDHAVDSKYAGYLFTHSNPKTEELHSLVHALGIKKSVQSLSKPAHKDKVLLLAIIPSQHIMLDIASMPFEDVS